MKLLKLVKKKKSRSRLVKGFYYYGIPSKKFVKNTSKGITSSSNTDVFFQSQIFNLMFTPKNKEIKLIIKRNI